MLLGLPLPLAACRLPLATAAGADDIAALHRGQRRPSHRPTHPPAAVGLPSGMNSRNDCQQSSWSGARGPTSQRPTRTAGWLICSVPDRQGQQKDCGADGGGRQAQLGDGAARQGERGPCTFDYGFGSGS